MDPSDEYLISSVSCMKNQVKDLQTLIAPLVAQLQPLQKLLQENEKIFQDLEKQELTRVIELYEQDMREAYNGVKTFHEWEHCKLCDNCGRISFDNHLQYEDNTDGYGMSTGPYRSYYTCYKSEKPVSWSLSDFLKKRSQLKEKMVQEAEKGKDDPRDTRIGNKQPVDHSHRRRTKKGSC